ncbi:MAG: SHOCT domain-containing protein [Myxococcales bacterium]|nr:SHOCT domain-containing protein [Myxococcales bacterium]
MIIWLILLVAIVAGIVWALRSSATGGATRRPPALDALKQRYARGEIERDEFLAKRADLGG